MLGFIIIIVFYEMLLFCNYGQWIALFPLLKPSMCAASTSLIFGKGIPYLGPSKNPQMYPYDEKMLRNEVIYLHSLWHQGPPPDPNLNNPNPSPSSSRIPYVPNPIPFYYRSYYPLCHQEMPNPNPNPRSYYPLCHQQTPNPNHRSNYPLYHQQTTISNPRPKPCIRNSLQPTNPTSFKKENTSTTTTGKKRLREKRIKKKKNKKMPQPDPPPDLGPEWPCPKPLEPAPEASGWPALKPISTPKSLSADERACFAAIQIQCKAAKACSEFFVKRAHTNEDEDEVEDNSGDDGDDEMSEEGSDENEEFKFFFMMFMEDSELRSYFEKNYETGDFCCLVCRGIGKKVWRRYKGCVGLVQHSIAISKTKRKRAHRAFGQVVCKVLGWDFCRFPTIILKDEPLSRSLAKPVELQVI
jgi:hypothetical protein